MSKIRLLLPFTLIILNVINADNDKTEVVFVNVLHRHGARTPLHSKLYPTDPHKCAFTTLWPEGVGQLTNLGKNQTFRLGQWLRQRYTTLLTDRYSPGIIYVQSDDKDRTLMSVECVLAGMFPPTGSQVWSDKLDWQPIPVHTTPITADKVLSQPPNTRCPAYDQEWQRMFTSNETIRALNRTYSELLRWTSEHAGKNFTLESIGFIYDILFIESSDKLTLPGWTKKVFPEPMREANVIYFMLGSWTSKLIRLRTGLLLQDMIKNMEDKVHSRTTRSVHVYSAHDSTIIHLLVALGAFNNLQPPYAACLMMELQRGPGGDHYVSLFYRNSTSDSSEEQEPYLLTVRGCAPQCPLDKFIALSKPFIPKNWDLECGLESQQSRCSRSH